MTTGPSSSTEDDRPGAAAPEAAATPSGAAAAPQAASAAAEGAATAAEGSGAKPVTGGGVRQIVGEDFSLADSIGGVRGLLESVAPGLVFVVVFIVSGQQMVPPLVASLAVALVLVVARLIGGTPITQALGGVLGVVIGVVWAWRSGQAQDFYAFGLWTNAAYAVALLISVIVRWPVVGIVVALLRQEGFAWRTDPELRPRRRRYAIATWLWIALFVARLAVQLPLYLDASIVGLGTARLVMGVPLWALALWATWLLVREPSAAEDRS